MGTETTKTPRFPTGYPTPPDEVPIRDRGYYPPPNRTPVTGESEPGRVSVDIPAWGEGGRKPKPGRGPQEDVEGFLGRSMLFWMASKPVTPPSEEPGCGDTLPGMARPYIFSAPIQATTLSILGALALRLMMRHPATAALGAALMITSQNQKPDLL